MNFILYPLAVLGACFVGLLVHAFVRVLEGEAEAEIDRKISERIAESKRKIAAADQAVARHNEEAWEQFERRIREAARRN